MKAVKTNTKYISLVEASKLSSYSQEYLSLRARRGKLRALKIGRNWVTTRQWLQQYLRSAGEYKVHNGIIGKQKYVVPPTNLPIEGLVETPLLVPIRQLADSAFQVFKLAGALALVLFFTVCVYALDLPTKLENLALQLPNQVKSFGEGFDKGIRELTLETGIAVKNFDLNKSVQTFGEGFSYGIASPASVETFTQDYRKWIGESYTALDEKLGQGIAHDIAAIGQGYRNISDAIAQSIQGNIETLGDGISKAGQNTKRSFFAFGEALGDVSIGWQGNVLSVTQTSDGQIENFDPERLREGLAGLGLAVNINGQFEVGILTATTKVTTPKLEAQRLQLTDQRTGDVYCTWVDDGQLTTVRGKCDTIEIAGNANYGTDTSSTSSTTTDTSTTQSISDVTFTTDTSASTAITDESPSSTTDSTSSSQDGVTSTTSSSEDGTVALTP